MSKFSLGNLDRRFIYALVVLALVLPLINHYSVKPPRMESASHLFDLVESFEPKLGSISFISMDFGPNTIAENGPQAQVMIEHLMRKRIPIGFITMVVGAQPYLKSFPEDIARRLMRENPGQKWEYGKDWVNLGFQQGGYLAVRKIAQSQDLAKSLVRDVRGNSLSDLPIFNGVKTLENIRFLAEFTGSVGILPSFIQFFQKDTYKPLFAHGCTSITVPEGYIYLDSGQLTGLFEGIAGAAWYSELLKGKYANREPDTIGVTNTGLGVAHLIIMTLVVLGNLSALLQKWSV